ncbi:MAG: 50S ribosomal protein L2 [Candidatus Aenigmatarchaeota archaeon]|nr:50S ribosomal protein L2 [Candidatus Aenigmarchaeota archaeon]
MGKTLIVQARGRGGPRYRTPSHRFLGRVQYFPYGSFTAKVVDIMNDPGHFAPVMLVRDPNGREILHIAPEGIQAGDYIHYGQYSGIGSVVELSKVPIGTKISCIETYPGSGPKLCRSSGSFATVIGASGNKVTIQFATGREKTLDGRCRVMIGVPAGGGRLEKPWIKAGKRLHAMMARGKLYPRTVGVAMNPVDHPYGGKKKSAKFKTISRFAPPGRKIGSISARKTGKRK